MEMDAPESAVSAVIFSSQTNAPKRGDLVRIRRILLENGALKPIVDAVISLPKTWRTLTSSNPELVQLRNGDQLVQSFVDWLHTGVSETLETNQSGLVTLPLLTMIHVVQYFTYLRHMDLTHGELLKSLPGGFQGHCIGLLSAIAIATCDNEDKILDRVATVIDTSLAIGAYGDYAQVLAGTSSAVMAVRLTNQNAAQGLFNVLPKVRYISPLPTMVQSL